MKRVAIGVGVLFAAGLLLLFRNGSETPVESSAGGSTHDATLRRPTEGVSDAEVQPREVAELSATSAARRVASKLRPANAHNDADARWMSARFYPSEEEVKSVNEMVEVALPADLVPKSLSDLLMAQRALRDPERAQDARTVLENGAVRGATFALIALGQTLEPISPIDSQAYFRAAVSLGDWSPALRHRPNFDHASDVLATLRALEILERIDLARESRGLPRLTRELRPGLPMAIQAVAANSRILNPSLPEGE